jgi:hypothetical protein
MDSATRCIKIATHCNFDECSPACKALQQVGTQHHPTDTPSIDPIPQEPTTQELQVKLLTEHATFPTRATNGAAGCDVYSTITTVIQPGQQHTILLDISVQPPQDTYIQIASRRGIVVKHKKDVKAGKIDNDYTGNINVILHN